MHQRPRPTPSRLHPTSASPATSPATNPTRTNNSRDSDSGDSQDRLDSTAPGGPGIVLDEPYGSTQPAYGAGDRRQDAIKRLNQVVQVRALPESKREASSFLMLNTCFQNYFTKAALIILSTRTTLSPAFARTVSREKRVNKWVSSWNSSKLEEIFLLLRFGLPLMNP